MDSDKDYLNWISSLKERIRSAQIKAAIAVNDELINLYWEIGKSIVAGKMQRNMSKTF